MKLYTHQQKSTLKTIFGGTVHNICVYDMHVSLRRYDFVVKSD